MTKRAVFLRMSAIAGAVIALGVVVAVTDARAQARNPLDALLAMVTAIRDQVMHPDHGLAEIKREIRIIEAQTAPATGPFRLSSGLFGIPATAQSVDWMVVNNAPTAQTVTVTVYRHGIAIPRAVVPPGALSFTLAPTETTHNANSVGFGLPFEVGFYYEVEVQAAHPNVLPSVHVWPSHFNEPIPGTLIPPGSWVKLQ